MSGVHKVRVFVTTETLTDFDTQRTIQHLKERDIPVRVTTIPLRETDLAGDVLSEFGLSVSTVSVVVEDHGWTGYRPELIDELRQCVGCGGWMLPPRCPDHLNMLNIVHCHDIGVRIVDMLEMRRRNAQRKKRKRKR